jgi:hypothetical protein
VIPTNFWDTRYASDDFVYGTEPNRFLYDQAHRMNPGSEVLCLAEGEGRNSTYLAGLGHHVTGVDASSVGVEKTRRLARERGVEVTTVVADLAEYDLGSERWDVVVSIFAHLPPSIRVPLRERLRRALRVGGLLILEHYHPRQLEYGTGGPSDVTMLTSLGELEAEFPDWEYLHRFEGEREVMEGTFHNGLAYVTQFVGRRAR